MSDCDLCQLIQEGPLKTICVYRGFYVLLYYWISKKQQDEVAVRLRTQFLDEVSQLTILAFVGFQTSTFTALESYVSG